MAHFGEGCPDVCGSTIANFAHCLHRPCFSQGPSADIIDVENRGSEPWPAGSEVSPEEQRSKQHGHDERAGTVGVIDVRIHELTIRPGQRRQQSRRSADDPSLSAHTNSRGEQWDDNVGPMPTRVNW